MFDYFILKASTVPSHSETSVHDLKWFESKKTRSRSSAYKIRIQRKGGLICKSAVLIYFIRQNGFLRPCNTVDRRSAFAPKIRSGSKWCPAGPTLVLLIQRAQIMVSHPGHPLFLALVTLCNFISVLLFLNWVCSVCAWGILRNLYIADSRDTVMVPYTLLRYGHTVACLLNYPLIHETAVSQPPWIQAYSQAGLAK